MNIPNSQQLVRLSAAVMNVEAITGETPHVTTLHRWATRGLAGVKLRTMYAGGYRRTSEEWIREFFEAVSAAKNGDDGMKHQLSVSRRSRIARAEKELEDAGI